MPKAGGSFTIVVMLLAFAAAIALARTERGGQPGTTEPQRHDAAGPTAAGGGAAPATAPLSADGGGSERQERSWPLAGPRHLTGHVVDPSGAPVAGADVRALALERQLGSAVTGADGSFRLPIGRDGVLAVTVLARAPHWAPGILEHDASAGTAVADLGAITLPAPGSIAGRILDDEGRPCTQARVELRAENGAMLRLPLPAIAVCVPERGVDLDGGYVIDGLPAGAYVVVARAPGRQRGSSARLGVRADAVTEAAPIVLGPGFALSGAVTDASGRPVPAADVTVVGAATGSRTSNRTQSDAAGAFWLPHLPPGPVHLRVAHDGMRTFVQRDIDPTQEPFLAVRLDQGALLRGRVVAAKATSLPAGLGVRLRRDDGTGAGDAAGIAGEIARLRTAAAGLQQSGNDPAALQATLQRLAALEQERRAALAAQQPFGATPQPRSRPLRVQADGSFSVAGLDDGSYSLEVTAAGLQPVRFGPFEVRGGTGPAHLEIAAPASPPAGR